MRRTRPKKTSTTGMVVRVGNAMKGRRSVMAGGLFLRNRSRWRGESLFVKLFQSRGVWP